MRSYKNRVKDKIEDIDTIDIEAIAKISEEIKKSKAKTIVVIGSSGQLAALLIKTYWKKYFKAKMPKFYALGDLLDQRRNNLKLKDFSKEINFIQEKMPSLLEAIKSKYILLDEYVYSESTMKAAKQLFKKLEKEFTKNKNPKCLTASMYYSDKQKLDIKGKRKIFPPEFYRARKIIMPPDKIDHIRQNRSDKRKVLENLKKVKRKLKRIIHQ